MKGIAMKMKFGFLVVCSSAALAGCAGFSPVGPVEALSETVPDRAQTPVVQGDVGDYANVCRLTIVRSYMGIGKKTSIGSGVLIGDRHVLTAAHNIFNPFYHPLRRIEVRCGISDPANAHLSPSRRVSKRFVAKGYRWGPGNGDEYQVDYGLLELNEPFAGIAPASLAETDAVLRQDVTIAGFPLVNNDPSLNGKTMFNGSGVITDRNKQRVTYSIRTFGGNSGGPVFNDDGDIVAIHVTNSGGRIVDKGMRDQVRDWLDQ